jgi:hypothetical protein
VTQIELVAAFLASSSTSTPYTPSFPGGIIAWIVCYKQRRSEIGGWLLFYYWHLYAGVLLTLMFFALAFQSYVPESFQNPTDYHLFLVTAVPSIVLFAVEVAIGTMLISVRTWDMLCLLRWVMVASVIWEAIAITINSQKFPDNVPLDFYSGGMSLVWLIYFLVSKRVKHVFKAHDWEVAVETIHPDPNSVSVT